METKNLWIARDKDNSIFLYTVEPIKKDDKFIPVEGTDYLELDETYYSNITWENSPTILI